MSDISGPCPTLAQIKEQYDLDPYAKCIMQDRDNIYRACAEVSALLERAEGECKWQYKNYPNLGAGEWVTTCGYFMGLHDYKFCPYCGKKIKESEARHAQ